MRLSSAVFARVLERSAMQFAVALYVLAFLSATATASHKCVLRDNPNLPPAVLPDININDDYCDCLDGSDEYLTPACPNGTFICQNTAFRKIPISSSWVRDGACDCCDGSDERPGHCPDTCATLRRAQLAEAKKHADAILRGVAARQKYIQAATVSTQEDARGLRKLKRELASVEKHLHTSKTSADALRKRREWAHRAPNVNTDDSASGSEVRADANDYTHNEYDHDDHDHDDHDDDDNDDDDNDDDDNDDDDYHYEERDDIGDDADGVYDDSAGKDDQKSDSDEDDFDDIDDDHLDGYDDDHDVESTQHTHGEVSKDDDSPGKTNTANLDSGADNKKQPATSHNEVDDNVDASKEASKGDQVSSDESTEKEDAEPKVNIDSVCADLATQSSNSLFRTIAYARAMVLAKLHRAFPKLFPVSSDSAISGIDACIRQADSAKWDLESKKTDLEEKIKKLKDKEGVFYGVDGAMRKLHGECTRTKVTQYEFEHCPFDLVRQYEHGSAIAVLGRFDGWEGDGDSRVMKYSNGDGCWNGPARSIKVHLECGEKEEIVGVDEPNRCTYTMKFRTPTVCQKKMADDIMADFNSDGERKDEL